MSTPQPCSAHVAACASSSRGLHVTLSRRGVPTRKVGKPPPPPARVRSSARTAGPGGQATRSASAAAVSSTFTVLPFRSSPSGVLLPSRSSAVSGTAASLGGWSRTTFRVASCDSSAAPEIGSQCKTRASWRAASPSRAGSPRAGGSGSKATGDGSVMASRPLSALASTARNEATAAASAGSARRASCCAVNTSRISDEGSGAAAALRSATSCAGLRPARPATTAARASRISSVSDASSAASGRGGRRLRYASAWAGGSQDVCLFTSSQATCATLRSIAPSERPRSSSGSATATACSTAAVRAKTGSLSKHDVHCRAPAGAGAPGWCFGTRAGRCTYGSAADTRHGAVPPNMPQHRSYPAPTPALARPR